MAVCSIDGSWYITKVDLCDTDYISIFVVIRLAQAVIIVPYRLLSGYERYSLMDSLWYVWLSFCVSSLLIYILNILSCALHLLKGARKRAIAV